MNIHEYQGKQILKQFGVSVPAGEVAHTPEQACEAARRIQSETHTDTWAVKAQIHAGGRGKGGGVKIARSLDEVKKHAASIIDMDLVTHQTGPQGKKVRKVLIEQGIYYPGESEPREFYMGVLLNRETGRSIIMYSTEGGMDIETVAEKTPHQGGRNCPHGEEKREAKPLLAWIQDSGDDLHKIPPEIGQNGRQGSGVKDNIEKDGRLPESREKGLGDNEMPG